MKNIRNRATTSRKSGKGVRPRAVPGKNARGAACRGCRVWSCRGRDTRLRASTVTCRQQPRRAAREGQLHVRGDRAAADAKGGDQRSLVSAALGLQGAFTPPPLAVSVACSLTMTRAQPLCQHASFKLIHGDRPMDLQIMRGRCVALEYKTADMLKADLDMLEDLSRRALGDSHPTHIGAQAIRHDGKDALRMVSARAGCVPSQWCGCTYVARVADDVGVGLPPHRSGRR